MSKASKNRNCQSKHKHRTLQLQVLYYTEIEELTVAKLIRNGNRFLNADFERIGLGRRSRHCYPQAFPRDFRN